MRKQVWLAALTAAFIAGGMAIAHAQGAGGGGGGDGSNAGAPPSSGANSSRSAGNPYFKDERFAPIGPRGSPYP